ncbi:hypothetical protein ACTOJ1_000521 [Shigella flexneri]
MLEKIKHDDIYKVSKNFKNKNGESCQKIISTLDINDHKSSRKIGFCEKASILLYNLFNGPQKNKIRTGIITNIEQVVDHNKIISTIFEIDNKRYVTASMMDNKKIGDNIEFYTNSNQESYFNFAERVIILDKSSAKKIRNNKALNKITGYFFVFLTLFIFFLMGKIFSYHGFSFLSFFYCWLMTSFIPITLGLSISLLEKGTSYYFNDRDQKIIKEYIKGNKIEATSNIYSSSHSKKGIKTVV